MINKIKLSIIIILFIAAISITGCLKKECETNNDCSARNCFTVECKNKKCAYTPINGCCGNKICETGENYSSCAADCPNCGDNNDCTIDSYDYHKQQCVNAPVTDRVCCGNGICEPKETHATCTRDCPNCDDGSECTKDKYDYYTQKCSNEIIIPCCGNGICDEGAETSLDCQTDCPDCDDNNKFTGDEFNYTTQKCEYVKYYIFEDFNKGTVSFSQDPRWSVQFPTDESNGVLTNKANEVFSSFGDWAWTDYFFDFKIKLNSGSALAYIRSKFTKDGPSGAYRVFISGTQLSLDKDMGKEEKSIKLKTQRYLFDSNKYYHVRIEAKGGNIKIYINDNVLIDYTDKDPLLSGNVGIEVIGQGAANSAYFDDIIVGPIK